MNKKFSTLMASVLLASAFSTSALAATGVISSTKTGDQVVLETATDALLVRNGVVTLAGTNGAGLVNNIKSATAANVPAEINKLDSVMWNVEVVKTATAQGPITAYRFANKVTGEYLAYTLKTDGSGNPTKMNQGGNKTWAVDASDVLYAYKTAATTAEADSIFYLDVVSGQLQLASMKAAGSSFPGTAVKVQTGDLSAGVPMTAAIFNTIMGKFDGKLHFNNDKDVTSNETNVLKDTKWKAVDFNTTNKTIALTNGVTKAGKNDALTADLAKKQYLIVDTLFLDKGDKKYFQLGVDTVQYEENFTAAAPATKPLAKRTYKQAEFQAEYFFGKDSIALAAVNIPDADGSGNFWSNGLQPTVSPALPSGTASALVKGQVALRQLGSSVVLTVIGKSSEAATGWIVPMIQPYAKAASAGDAVIDTKSVVYSLQVAGENASLRASSLKGYYLTSSDVNDISCSDEVDGSNVYAQWAFIEGSAGTYRIVNRATEAVYYTGAVSILKDAKGNKVADTYVVGNDTVKIAKVDLSGANVVTEGKNQYDYSAAYFAGDAIGLTQAFSLNPVSPFMSALAMQYVINNGDTTLVLGDADEAPVWKLKKAESKTFGLKIEGLPQLKKQLYNIYTKDDEDIEYYVIANKGDDMTLANANQFSTTKPATAFEFVTAAKDQYIVVAYNGTTDTTKMTINPTPAKPQLEATPIDDLRTDLFTINKTEAANYRTLTAEDGVLGNAAIYMENEPSRYLYENSQNIVANNGNKVAKDSLNFLGIFNAFELDKNPTVYVDTAWVNRKGNWMPQYMFGLNVQEVEATEGVPCSYTHNHYDNAGNKVDAAHCSHAVAPTAGYRTGRYLMSLADSVPANVKNTPVKYDNQVRLAFIEATIYPGQDTIIVNNSKYTGNSKQIVAGAAQTYASHDTLKIADQALNPATFALRIADQETQSFYLETVKKGTAAQFVRILNGVPVLTDDIKDAAIFNIEASELEATANESIEASEVVVIAGKGVVTVQGAAGKVITVANILGQTIANQVAASDNVTIAAPAGVVVVAVDGEATKVVVK